MKNRKLTNILFSTATALTMLGCSSDGGEDPYTPPIDPPTSGGENPPPGSGTTDPVPSDDISTLWIANFARAQKDEYIAITNGREMPNHGNVLYRQNLKIPDSVSIFTVSGGCYNKDGTYPTSSDDLYTAYDKNDVKRNNVTISFIFTDEASANAELVIDNAMAFASQSWKVQYENNSTREIEKGAFTIKAKDERLQDAIPPLGKDKDGNILKSFKFKDIDINGDYNINQMNGLKYGPKDAASNIDIPHSILVSMFKTQGNKFPIKIIETAIVQGGQRLEPVTKPQ